MQHKLALDFRIGFGDFDLEIAHELPLDGITGLFGASGSGKSTVLRVIAGLERNARGRVAFDGRAWMDSGARRFVEPWRRGVGVVFQDARLFPHLDVHGNLRFAERRSRRGAAGIDLRNVVDALDLAPLLGRRPASLSGGEQQRVAIARTLLARPVLLLMDEPLSALDLKRKAAILPYIEKLPELFGIPIVYVTHAIDEVARLATRMVVLDAGRVRAAGPLTEVLERLDLQPATGRFEAGVVVSATVAGHDERFRLTLLDCAGQTIAMPEADVETGATVRLRIRARDVALARTRPSGLSIRNVLSGTIEKIIEEPDTAFAETLVDIGGAAIRARLTRASVADLALKEGEPVFVLVKSIAFDRRALA